MRGAEHPVTFRLLTLPDRSKLWDHSEPSEVQQMPYCMVLRREVPEGNGDFEF
jgi:hypothetical protein